MKLKQLVLDVLKNEFDRKNRELLCPIFFKISEYTELLIDALEADDLINTHQLGTSIFFFMIKNSENENIWKCIKKILPENEEINLLKKRLEMVLAKDEHNLSVVDYSIIMKRCVFVEFIKAITSKVNGEEIEFPQIL